MIEEKKMIVVKDAISKAISYFRNLCPEYKSITLEEVELSEDEKYWLITLGGSEVIDFVNMRPSLTSKEYKIFKIEYDTGKFISMKIREVNTI